MLAIIHRVDKTGNKAAVRSFHSSIWVTSCTNINPPDTSWTGLTVQEDQHTEMVVRLLQLSGSCCQHLPRGTLQMSWPAAAFLEPCPRVLLDPPWIAVSHLLKDKFTEWWRKPDLMFYSVLRNIPWDHSRPAWKKNSQSRWQTWDGFI